MAQQSINVGTAANDGTGDDLRTSFSKTNSNFGELYDAVEALAGEVAEIDDEGASAVLPAGGDTGDYVRKQSDTEGDAVWSGLVVESNVQPFAGAVQIANVVGVTQAQYDAIDPKPADVLFVIVEA